VKTPGLAGDFVDFVVAVLDFFAEGKHAEEFVTAGDAAESRNTQGPPQGSGKAIGEIASNALDVNIAADGTVSDERVREWCGARPKTPGTSRTTPRHAADDTSEVVEKSSSARPAAFGRITNWAIHCGFRHLGWKRACAMLWEFTLVSKAQLERRCKK
jgi:hypothetical protein